MDRATEERFVRTFVSKQRRERLLLELVTPSRRQTGILRFCHSAAPVIDFRTLVYRGKKLKREDMERLLLPHAERGMCYAISTNETIDGRFLPISEALDSLLGFGMPSILICAHAALIECEQEQGAAEKLILVERCR